MSTLFADIRMLCDFLEAELEGRPYDRSLAKELAHNLGQKFPSIRNSMSLLCERVKDDTELATASAA